MISAAYSTLRGIYLSYPRKLIIIFILSAVLGNLYYLPAHKTVAMSGHLREYYLYTGKMMRMLKMTYDKGTGKYVIDRKLYSDSPALVVLLSSNKYGSALEQTPADWVNLSLLRYRSGNFPGCIQAAEEALRLRPDYATAYNNICVAWNALGEWDKAVVAGEHAVALEPDSILAKNNLAWAKSHGGGLK